MNNRGSILVFSVLLLGVMLLMAVTVATVFVPHFLASNNAIRSAVAFGAADSIAEQCLYQARKQTINSPLLTNPLTNGALVTVASLSATEVDVTNDCRALGTTIFRFRATGVYQGTSRALEVSQ